jgi:hypothetical protein
VLVRAGRFIFTETNMLIRICDITATVRHVEVPAKCPGCQEPVEAVSEINLTDS